MHFEDGTGTDFDVIVYATGYNITFPFFDPGFLSAPGNQIQLYKRILKPGMDDLAFAGFAQATPTLFPFVECQARMIAAYAAGHYRPPSVARDGARHRRGRAAVHRPRAWTGPRHTQQVDYFIYEHDMRAKEIPAGRRRARDGWRDDRRGRPRLRTVVRRTAATSAGPRC